MNGRHAPPVILDSTGVLLLVDMQGIAEASTTAVANAGVRFEGCWKRFNPGGAHSPVVAMAFTSTTMSTMSTDAGDSWGIMFAVSTAFTSTSVSFSATTTMSTSLQATTIVVSPVPTTSSSPASRLRGPPYAYLVLSINNNMYNTNIIPVSNKL